MNQACTNTTYQYQTGGITAQPAKPGTAPLLVELVQELRPLRPSGDAPTATHRQAALLARLLAANQRSWPALQQPEGLAFDLNIRNDRLRIRIMPLDWAGPLLEVQFDRTGRLLTWQSWSAKPPPNQTWAHL
jgi:hypothetical protein